MKQLSFQVFPGERIIDEVCCCRSVIAWRLARLESSNSDDLLAVLIIVPAKSGCNWAIMPWEIGNQARTTTSDGPFQR